MLIIYMKNIYMKNILHILIRNLLIKYNSKKFFSNIQKIYNNSILKSISFFLIKKESKFIIAVA